MGDFYTGKISNFRLLYEAIKLFSSGLFDFVPVSLNVEHNLIPVDVAARAIRILTESEKKGRTYHVISPNNIPCYYLMNKAAKYFGYSNPKWINLTKQILRKYSFVQKEMINPFLPYFNYKGTYTGLLTHSLLKKYSFAIPNINEAYLDRIFKYCDEVGYIKRLNQY